MSMIYTLRQASHSIIEMLHADPSLITLFFRYGSERPQKHAGFFARLLRTGRSTSPAPPVPEFPSDVDDCGLEKEWHGLHYLLCGSDWEGEPPASFLLNWGSEIGNVDLGYGPARSFTPPETSRIGEFLSQVDSNLLRTRFDPEKMSQLELYPNRWKDKPDDKLRDLIHAYEDLRRFVDKTVARGFGMVGYIG